MRFVLPCALVALAACSKPQPAAPPILAGMYAGPGRDALCIQSSGEGTRVGFIVYGADDANCSASGRLEAAGSGWTLLPAGDSECRIPVAFGKGAVALGTQSAACAYYCGPGARFGEATFNLTPKPPAAVDVAGDPLC